MPTLPPLPDCQPAPTLERLRGKIRLVSSFEQHLDLRHASVAIWDNTLMSTPRDHFARVAAALGGRSSCSGMAGGESSAAGFSPPPGFGFASVGVSLSSTRML